jgi:hypothetical protein
MEKREYSKVQAAKAARQLVDWRDKVRVKDVMFAYVR